MNEENNNPNLPDPYHQNAAQNDFGQYDVITEEPSLPDYNEYNHEDINDLRREIQEANGALQKAIEEKQNAISKGDVAVMKNMKRPTEQTKLIAALVCKIFNTKPHFNSLTKTYDYWTPALKLFNSRSFLTDVQNFDVSTLSLQTIIEIEHTTNSDDFNMEKFKNASDIAHNFARWVLAIIIAFRSMQVVEEFEKAIESA